MYVDRDNQGHIVSMYARPQRKGHEFVEGAQLWEPFDVRRAKEYPSPFEFIDAQVKKASGDPALVAEGKVQEDKYVRDCLAVKARHPKDPAPGV